MISVRHCGAKRDRPIRYHPDANDGESQLLAVISRHGQFSGRANVAVTVNTGVTLQQDGSYSQRRR